MDGNEKITVKYLSELFAANKGEGPLFEEAQKHFESENAEALYNAATREDATQEDKIKWAVYSLELHRKLNAYLADINQRVPEKFAEDTVANINEAYAVNSHLCADAITKDPEGLVQTLVNRSYEKMMKLGAYDPNGNNAAEYEEELARILYLGKLKYELQNVHGSEEEMKRWKAEILTELMSDSFDKNVAQYKNSRIFKESRQKLTDNPALEPEEAIQNAILSIAEEKYHGIYYTFGNVVNSEADKKKVIEVTDEIEEMKALANTVGVSRGGNENKVDMEYNHYLDTVFMKRRAFLYGDQEDYITFIKRLEAKDQRAKDRVQWRIDKAWKEFREKNQARIDKANAPITEAKRVKDIINQIAQIEKENDIVNKSIQLMAKDPSFMVINQDNKVSPLQEQFNILQKNKNKKGELMGSIYGRHGNDTKKYMAMIQVDETYEKYLRDEQYNIKHGVEADLKREFQQIEADIRKRENELQKNLDDMEWNELLQEPVKVMEENKEYEKALKENNVDKIKEIKENRVKRDLRYKQENSNFYKIKYYTDSNKEFHVLYRSKPTETALADMEKDFSEYKKTHKIFKERQQKFDDNQIDFRQKDVKYQEISKIARPDRKGITINAFKAPVVAELNLDNIAVEENVTYKYQEKEQFLVVAERDNPSAQITFAIEYAQKRAKVLFGTKEYDDILEGLQEAKLQIENKADAKTQLLPLLKKLDVMMEQYLDRKDDQIRRGKDSRTTKERRANIVDAQECVKKAFNSVLESNRLNENDYVCEEALYDLENIEKLTKETNPEVVKIKDALKAKKMVDALDLMNEYMSARVNKYHHNGQYKFIRGVTGEDTKGRYNIPSKTDERFYRSILTQFDKLLQAQLETFQKTNLSDMERLKFNVKYAGTPHIQDKIGLREKYGIRTNVDYYVLPLEIQKTNNFDDYSKQFANHYTGLAAKMRYGGIEKKIQDPQNYNADAILTVNERQYMNEAALSSMFLEKNYKNKPFDFDQMEADRVKFISLVKSTNLFHRINHYGMEIQDLQSMTGTPEEIRKNAFETFKKIKNPQDYSKEVVTKAIQDEFMELFNKAADNIQKEKGYNANEATKSIKDVELICKLGKALGISDSLGKANNKIENEKLKGQTIEDSVKKLKEMNQEKAMKKYVAPVKGV